MKIINLLNFLILIASSNLLFASEVGSVASEELGVKLCQVRLHHQDLWRTLNIKLWYETKQGEKATGAAVKEFTKNFLADYPNPSDFWEILNKKMAESLVAHFPIESMEIELSIIPDETVPVQRRSVMRYQNGAFSELFGFKHEHQSKVQELLKGASLDIFYRYKEGILPSEYPDFLWLCATIDAFVEENPIENSSWESYKHALMQHLMEKYPMVECLDIQLIG